MIDHILAAQLKIEGWDLAIIILYLVGIVTLGCWAGLRHRRKAEGKGYFLAGGTLRWPIIGLALFSTNISTIHLVSQAQEGYKNGLAYGNFEWMAPFTLIALSLFFAPFYIRSKVATLPDFLEKRYCRNCRDWLAVLSIVSAVVIHIGFSLYTGAVVLEGLFDMPKMTSIIIISVLTGLYTIIGGLLAVVLTESIQTIVLLIGAICITVLGLHYVGGWEGLTSHVEPAKMTLLRSADDPADLPWYSVFLGYPIIGLWYWCADQTIVQRVLGAKDENHARIGPLFAGFIKILPVFIFVMPGTICLALINKGVIPALTNDEDTYGHLIREILPVGLKGLVAAALLAALMGTVSGALNSIATLFSYDIFRRWKPDTSDKQLVFIGRIVTFVAMIIAILWSPLIAHWESIYKGSNTLICYIAPPITVVFLWGVFWKRASSAGAQAALYIGSFLGLVVTLLDWYKEYTGWNIQFMMSAFYLFVICSIILIAVSLWKPHQHTEESKKLVWKHPLEPLKGAAWKGIGNYKLLAGILFVAMIALYIGFSKLHRRPADAPTNVEAGLKYAYYEGEWENLPEIDILLPTHSGKTDNFDLELTTKDQGYLIQYTGYLDIAEAGRYTFHVKYGDQCHIHIGPVNLPLYDYKEENQPKAIENVNQKYTFIDLEPGKHALSVIYHQHQKDPPELLEISYEGPGVKKTRIPTRVLFRSTDAP